MASLTKADWKDRIAPHLSTSLQTVSETITQTKAVRTWLRTASTKAAEGLGDLSGMQGEMQGYMRMMNDLEDELPALMAAVDELTEGCGRVELHWRPLHPDFSRLYVDFDRDYDVELFVRLSGCTDDDARDAVAAVADALPKGEPFPNRPNVTTGLVAHDGTGVGVRVNEHLRDDRSGTYHSATLLPPDQTAIENLGLSDAPRRLRRLLCTDSEASS